jgi:NDP-sugar pyrophosphorylase family protein
MSRAPASHAMILCAGFGERLKPLSDEQPKPLVPVGDRSVLAHIATRLSLAGYRSALVNTHWLHEKFEAITDCFDLDLTLIHEPEIRGQAGGIAGARHLLEAPVIAWNGDILIDEPPLPELVARVRASSGICLAVAPVAAGGTVGLDAAGRLVRVRGQSFGTEVRTANYLGLLALGEAALHELPERGCLFDDFMLPRLRRGEAVETCLTHTGWQEVGSLEGYWKANERWLSHHANHGERSYVHPSARVAAGVQLISSVVGANARLEGVGTIARSIIWPNSQATAPFDKGIVTPKVRVHR